MSENERDIIEAARIWAAAVVLVRQARERYEAALHAASAVGEGVREVASGPLRVMSDSADAYEKAAAKRMEELVEQMAKVQP